MTDSKGAVGRRARLQTRAVLIAASTALIAYLVGGMLGWWTGPDGVESLVIIGTSLIFVGLGALIIGKANSHPVGWVFALVGLSIVLSGVAGGLADRGLVVFDAIGGAFWLSWLAAVGLVVLWYPTGRPPSSRWMWVQWLGFVTIGLTFVLYLFAEELCSDFSEPQGCVSSVANPIGISGVPNPEYGWISDPLFVGAAVFLLASLASLVVRFRRARGVERLQLKWFLLACAVFAVAFAGTISYESWSGRSSPSWLNLLFQVAILSIPVAATVAILRYRLYEIDRIISRTLSYTGVVALLVAGVAGLAALVGTRFTQPLVVAATTLGAAATFNPLRVRVQTVVDRRFNRSRYDAGRVMDEFAASLRDRVDPDAVINGWAGVVSETMQPESFGIWVRT